VYYHFAHSPENCRSGGQISYFYDGTGVDSHYSFFFSTILTLMAIFLIIVV
jgi:hypothetical protein